MKLSLASDLHWMIREGHVIEFNDGSLDLPRAKPPKKEPAPSTVVPGGNAAAAEVMPAASSGADGSHSSLEAAVARGIETLPAEAAEDKGGTQHSPPETAAAT
jgi:hypothetical protein